mgnify:CR=1 FL=1
MSTYFLIDDNNLVANAVDGFPNTESIRNHFKDNWHITEESKSSIYGKVYDVSNETFSEPTGELIGIEPVSQSPFEDL